ncbi:macrophage scavenger receptor types I and II-like [Lingula anatina]|uniref:Macrophage scavenger receptor types I and II-like n=1 Tax=Lingula anatina TaxID=7574 RepID=A0A1S3HLM0_LINAN|nr:macrophage scavenger receptor types I and II-like [Lingula anatina]|eukprot:XP_013386361.1 macrophage scavenger receptor types I and II-like [Lingula anatina]
MQQVQRSDNSFNKTLQGVEQMVKNSLLTDASIQAEKAALTNQVATLKQELQQLKDSSKRERTLLTNKIQSLEQQQHMLVQQTSNVIDQLLTGRIRLVNGSHSREGRIEVFYKGQWGTVCDDRFDVKDARVVCRQLGYPTAYPTVYASARFGQGTDPIWLDDLDCVGSELDIKSCANRGWGKHDCFHTEDVGVSC